MKSVICVSGFIVLLFVMTVSVATGGQEKSDITFHPVQHATLVIESADAVIYVDPVGDSDRFNPYPKPDIILITDIHGDHLDKDVVDKLKTEDTRIVASGPAVDQLGQGKALKNGDVYTLQGVEIEAIPAYNITKDRMNFHPKGRGNGYVISLSGKRIYISGDTEDIPEMRKLKHIDYAFLCMNLPYTMTEDQAASAVLEFKPKVVIPYHYRGKGGLSDIAKFKQLVEKNDGIQVKEMAWYD